MSQQCLEKISNKFNTLFEQVQNYEKTDMDGEHSAVIPTPIYLLSLMECKNSSERKYLESDKLEDEVEYLRIHKAVQKVLRYRTRMAKDHQQKAKALARILAKCIKRAVARSVKY
ncbi:hypothetical protein JTB14_003136 [Gonioctena quinquepunctata]|nr:hypothetical protein JTB14_003136 [Gonioctena quinquepunctata]